MWVRTAVVAAIVFGAASAYGWWFHFSVGPAHGAGAELGVLAGILAVAAIVLAIWLDKRRSLGNEGRT
jgi:hypothetical protein